MSSAGFSLFLGILGTSIGVIQFMRSIIPSGELTTTKMNIAVALEADGEPASFAGEIDVRLFNVFGELVGPPKVDKHLSTGNARGEISYEHHRDKAGQQGAYALLTANDDAICIAWVAVKWPDGSQWVWMGDWAHPDGCGNAPWAYSNMIIGSSKEGAHYPKCIWIDKNGDPGPQTSFQVYFPDFAVQPNGSYPTDKSVLCDTPAYRTSTRPDNNGIFFWTPPRQAPPTAPISSLKALSHQDTTDYWAQSKNVSTWRISSGTQNSEIPELTDMLHDSRRLTGRLYSTDNRAISSSKPQHLASALCASDTSWGPSFISKAEGMFCDMKTKTLYTLCSDGVGGECFDEASTSIFSGAIGGRARAKRTIQFSKVIDWDDEASQ